MFSPEPQFSNAWHGKPGVERDVEAWEPVGRGAPLITHKVTTAETDVYLRATILER